MRIFCRICTSSCVSTICRLSGETSFLAVRSIFEHTPAPLAKISRNSDTLLYFPGFLNGVLSPLQPALPVFLLGFDAFYIMFHLVITNHMTDKNDSCTQQPDNCCHTLDTRDCWCQFKQMSFDKQYLPGFTIMCDIQKRYSPGNSQNGNTKSNIP